MSHTFPYSDNYFTGFSEDAEKRVTGAEIERVEADCSSCDGCAQKATHAEKYCPFTHKRTGAPDPIEAKTIPQAAWFWYIQLYLWVLYRIPVGLPTLDWKYNAGSGNNFLDVLGQWEVTGASGQWLTLAVASTDPRACTPGVNYDNPDWPFSGPRYLQTGGGGSLQQGDGISFLGSNLAGLGAMTWIEEIDYTNVGSGSFRVKIPITATGAAVSVDGATCYVRAWRRVYSNQQWQYIPESRPFYGTKVVESHAVADVVSLDHLAHPTKLTVMVGQINVTGYILAGKRITNEGAYSKLYLGATNWDGFSVTDLTGLGSTVVVSYWKYDSTSRAVIGQAACEYCKTTGRISGVSSGVVNHGDLSHYCDKRGDNPSALASFGEYCNLYHCDQYRERANPWTASEIAAFFDRVFFAQDIYIRQAAAGSNNYTIHTADHASICQLLGHFRITSPVTWRERIEAQYNGLYDTFDRSGALINNEEDLSTYEPASGIITGEDYCKERLTGDNVGQLPALVSGWFTKRNRYKWSEVSADEWKNLLPYLQKGGYRPDHLDTTGDRDERDHARGRDIIDAFLFTLLSGAPSGSNQYGTIERGGWDADLQENESGDYTVKISLSGGLISQTLSAIVSGVIERAERVDGNTIKIHCKLGTASVGKQAGAWTWEDEVRQYASGGNIVDPPDYLKPNNYYANNHYGTNQFAQAGDAIHLTFSGVNIVLAIKEAWPFTGDSLSFVPSCARAASWFTVPYNDTGADIPWKIEAQRGVGGADPAAAMHLTELAYCPDCDAQKKFHFIYNPGTDNEWECVTCGYSYTVTDFPWAEDDDFEGEGKPPDSWTLANGASAAQALAMDLDDNEWALRYVLDEDGALDHCEIHFSARVFDHLDGDADLKVNVYYVGSGSPVEYQPMDMQADMEITEEEYDAISDDDFYAQIEDYDGTLQDLTETADADIRNWWDPTGAEDKRFQFQKWTAGGHWYIRFHSDFQGRRGKIYFPETPAGGVGSSDYYDDNIAGMPGLHSRHKDYACKADVLVCKDFGYFSDLGDLADLAFSVFCDPTAHDDSTITVKATERGVDAWATINSADWEFFPALGVILIKAAAVSGYTNLCIKVE